MDRIQEQNALFYSIYNEILREFGTIDGTKEQIYEILRFTLHKEYMTVKIGEAIGEIIEKDLLFRQTKYRISLLELDKCLIDTKGNLSKEEIELLIFLLRVTFPFPGIVGNPVEVLKLVDVKSNYLEVLEMQKKSGKDGFCSEYMISQMKGGLSVDILVGCPMGCRYCYRIDDVNMDNYIKAWNPSVIVTPDEIVSRLLNHPWFTPHITPIGIHMSTTEAFLEQIWPHTLHILKSLDEKGLTNRVSIITKTTLNDKNIAILGELRNISLDVCVCYSGMPKFVEPSSDKNRIEFLARLVKAEKKYSNLHAIAYYRPIIEGYNTSDEIIKETVQLLCLTNVKVVVLGGLKYSSTHNKYFMELAIPRPQGIYEEGKKYLNEKTIEKIMSIFREMAGDNMPAILRRSSCARVVSRGSYYPDYNAHWFVPERNCQLNCPQGAVCGLQRTPRNNEVDNLLERLGKKELKYCIGERVMVFSELTMYEKTFMTQNLYYGVWDKADILKAVLAYKEDNTIFNVLTKYIDQFLGIEDVKKLMSVKDNKTLGKILAIVKNHLDTIKEIPKEVEFEVNWAEMSLEIEKMTSVRYENLQLSLTVALELINLYIEQSKEYENCEYYFTCEKGRKLLHNLADKIVSIHKKEEFFQIDAITYYRFAKNYFEVRRKQNNVTNQIWGFALLIKYVEAKYRVISIGQKLDIGIVIPMKREVKNILSEQDIDGGRDAIRVKIEQLEWLFGDNSLLQYEIWFIDDQDPEMSGKLAESIISSMNFAKAKVIYFNDIIANAEYKKEDLNPVLKNCDNSNTWAKGAAVLWGLYEMGKMGKDVVIYSDLDLTYPLEQCGNLIFQCMVFGVGAVIGSRKMEDSRGYYGENGPNNTSQIYEKAISEIYRLKGIKDVQAGFKCLNGRMICDIIKRTYDRKLSFDAELLALCQEKWKIIEIGVVTIHQYINGKVGTERDYSVMLKDSMNISKQHGIVHCIEETPFYSTILEMKKI